VKPRLLDSECKNREAAQNTLAYVFTSTLQLLHPFMPFITEEIWQKFPHEGDSIMISRWPEYSADHNFEKEEEALKRIIEVITAIRNRRNEMNVPASKKVPIYIQTSFRVDFEDSTAFLTRLAGASQISFEKSYDPEECVSIATDSATVYIPLFELLDIEKEKERLQNEMKKLTVEIERLEKKLSNEQFVNKAPEKVVAAEREKLAGYQATFENIQATYHTLIKK
jgi:valyl-tRNA synthetase